MQNRNTNYPYYNEYPIKDLKEMLYYRYKNTPDKIAYSWVKNNETYKKTFKELYYDVTYLTAYYNKNYKNKHIGLISENSYNYIITILAIIFSGNVAVVIDKDSDEKALKEYLKKSDSKVICYSEEYCSFVAKMKFKKISFNKTQEFIELGKSLKNKYQFDKNKLAVILFTSGTTGANKAVMLSSDNIMKNIIGATAIFLESGPTVSILPFHHAFGLTTSGLMPIYNGFENRICSSLKNVVSSMQDIKVETIIVVPLFIETFYKQIYKNIRKQKKEKSFKRALHLSNMLLKVNIDIRKKLFKDILKTFGGNLNYIICGGAYLDPKYIHFFKSIGITILNGYGITECSPVVSVNRNNLQKEGSIGFPCKYVDVKIIDNEICIKGPTVMLGYYKDAINTKKVLIDGYFHTGDIGYLDDDGFIYITGRKKNIILLSNGENISPEAIEETFLKDKGVCEAVVYQKDGKLIISIFPNEEYLNDEDYFNDLLYKYNENKPINKQIAFVTLRSKEFIKNNNKKILRDKIYEGDN